MLSKALTKVTATQGEKTAIVAHIIGAKACLYASEAAHQAAQQGKLELDAKKGKVAIESGATTLKKCKAPSVVVQAVAKKIKQSELKVFRGINVLFSQADIIAIQNQFV